MNFEFPRGRLAPSPTGYLHLGNARSFLLAWLQMRSMGGEIILRIEDLDQARAVAGADRDIIADLRWLGLDWDNDPGPEYYQSQRAAIYRDAIAELRERGLAYECFCSRKELRGIASAPHGAAGDYYPGRCRHLTDGERAERREGKDPALRFVVPERSIEFTDLVAGYQRDVPAETSGDFIVGRADGVPGYQLAVVLDDMAMGITHVLRGDDLLASTPRQILLHTAFGGVPPAWAHVPLVLGADGARLAKRHGAVSLAELRAAGVRAEEVVGWLAQSWGGNRSGTPMTAAELIDGFRLDAIDRRPAMFEGSVRPASPSTGGTPDIAAGSDSRSSHTT